MRLISASIFAFAVQKAMSLSAPSATTLALSGKRALVTGSSGGIGAGIAKSLAAAGARVLVHYNTRQDGARATCRSILDSGVGGCDGIMKCDFRVPGAIGDMFAKVDDVWDGRLDILVNNAGVITKLAAEDDDDSMSAWHETMAVNLHAPLQLSRLAYSRMRRSSGGDGGVIINVSSIHGYRSVEYMTAYAASKAALDSLTRGLALEYALEGVRVNAIAPGFVPVERTAVVLSDPAVQEMWLPHLPVGRMGKVDEMGEATLHLCTSEWATGTILMVDGGMMSRANMPFRPRPPKPDSGEGDDVCSEVRFEKPY